MGLLSAESGTAEIFGLDCWKEGPSVRRRIGYVPGDVRLYPWLTLRSALQIISGTHRRDLIPAGLRLAERFRLEAGLPVRKMSRGNRQKVALVLSLCHTPDLVILDEPTSGLDPLMQDTLADCLREMAAEGRTVVFSSHTLSEVENLCDHIAIVRDGRIVEDATVDGLKAQAPRQIIVTLRPDQRADQIHWPPYVTHFQPQGKPTGSEPRRDVPMALTGSAVGFLEWAASQKFADVAIGQPSLEVLFRKYYDSSSETV